ncbi:MAG TPA: S66 peptidase family protein [Metabacillus sp.]|nr:S66 peptidase family protein [Metabacillus sp.]
MISYPILQSASVIGVTAPSSGVPPFLHEMFKEALTSIERKGYKVKCGDTVWTQHKAKSASANKRAEELNNMLQKDEISLIFPPWGGELLIEVIPYINFEKMQPKWVLGYSDTSLLLLAITLQTGIATAHGTNLVDIRGEYSDGTTAKWESVLKTKAGDSILQYSSIAFQKEWDHENPSPCIFHLTEKTVWKTISNKKEIISGRLLGGCIDVIRHLIGTPYGDVKTFMRKFVPGEENIIWYFENCELNTTDLRRTLVQMKLAGWFDHASGILFGRSAANQSVDQYTVIDVYQELAEELNIPVIFDIDCGHVPPQMTFINGAYAKVEVNDGKGSILQSFI